MSAVTPAAGRFRHATTLAWTAGPLLAVAAPVAVLAVALAAFTPAVTVQDSWLSLVSGREVAQHGLPLADHLTVLGSGHHWIDQQWLAGLLLYAAARIGGVGLALSVCVVALLVAFGAAALVAHRRGASPVAILLVFGAAVVSAPWGLQPRAQALALPLFALVLALLVDDPRAERRRTLLVLPLLCIWANVHGSVVVGALFVLVYAVRTRAWPYLLAPATVLVSPYVLQLPGYYRLMLLDPPFATYIKEWNRTTPSPLTAAFFALAALAVAVVFRRRARLTVFDRLALVLGIAVGLEAVRGLIWFAVVAAALLPAALTRAPGARFGGQVSAAFAGLAAAVVVASVGIVAARPARAYEARFPSTLADVVRTHAGSHGRVLANEGTADWLLWQLPELRGRIAFDVRFEVLSRRQVVRLSAWRNSRPGWQELAAPYAVVVDDPAHVAGLVETGGWRRVLASPHVAVAERISGER